MKVPRSAGRSGTAGALNPNPNCRLSTKPGTLAFKTDCASVVADRFSVANMICAAGDPVLSKKVSERDPRVSRDVDAGRLSAFADIEAGFVQREQSGGLRTLAASRGNTATAYISELTATTHCSRPGYRVGRGRHRKSTDIQLVQWRPARLSLTAFGPYCFGPGRRNSPIATPVQHARRTGCFQTFENSMRIKREAAFHEAGHAVAAHRSSFHNIVGPIDLGAYGSGEIYVSLSKAKLQAKGKTVDASSSRDKEVAIDLAVILAAGLIAERLAEENGLGVTANPECATPDHELLRQQLAYAGLSKTHYVYFLLAATNAKERLL